MPALIGLTAAWWGRTAEAGGLLVLSGSWLTVVSFAAIFTELFWWNVERWDRNLGLLHP